MTSQKTTMNAEPAKMQKPQTQTRDKEKRHFPRPKNRISKGVPKPQNLSKKETELSNDPLWLDSFVIDGETGFVSEEPVHTFNVDAAGYAQLVESEYKAISDVDKHYAKSVPASAHAYYHHTLLWYKIALAAQKQGTASFDQEKLVQFVSGYGSLEIAAGAGEYLTGLGDYTDSTGVKHIRTATEPTEQGHFGNVTAETHGFYETLPAPIITLQRIVEDMQVTNERQDTNDVWITPGIRPRAPHQQAEARGAQALPPRQRAREDIFLDEAVEGVETPEPAQAQIGPPEPLPTVNLLGWRPARRLTANQHNELSDLVDPNDIRGGLVNRRYCVNREVFEFVERRIRECKRYKHTILPATTTGSVVQQVIWKPLEPTRSRLHQAITGVGQATSRVRMPLRADVAAKVMCYRTLRRENYLELFQLQ